MIQSCCVILKGGRVGGVGAKLERLHRNEDICQCNPFTTLRIEHINPKCRLKWCLIEFIDWS
jgi:hypothetical protein